MWWKTRNGRKKTTLKLWIYWFWFVRRYFVFCFGWLRNGLRFDDWDKYWLGKCSTHSELELILFDYFVWRELWEETVNSVLGGSAGIRSHLANWISRRREKSILISVIVWRMLSKSFPFGQLPKWRIWNSPQIEFTSNLTRTFIVQCNSRPDTRASSHQSKSSRSRHSVYNSSKWPLSKTVSLRPSYRPVGHWQRCHISTVVWVITKSVFPSTRSMWVVVFFFILFAWKTHNNKASKKTNPTKIFSSRLTVCLSVENHRVKFLRIVCIFAAVWTLLHCDINQWILLNNQTLFTIVWFV